MSYSVSSLTFTIVFLIVVLIVFLIVFPCFLPYVSMQLDLGSRKKVIGVMLYSGGDAHRRVPKFSVRTSEDGREWNYFLDGYGNKMVRA